MNNNVFIEKSYVVASILSFKNKYMNKNFVTIDEVNYISDKLQKKINECNYNAVILDVIDREFFIVLDIIKVNIFNGLSLTSVCNRYQGNLDFDLLLLIWNEEFILECLTELMTTEIERMNQKYVDTKSSKEVKILKK